MSKDQKYTLGKEERLCKQRLIDELFSGKAETLMAWPIRMVCLLVDKQQEQAAGVQMMVSVSKRFFKHAVDRNRVKRQIRESFRLHRQELMEWMAGHPQKQLLVAYIWQDDKLQDSAVVEKAIIKLANMLSERLTPEGQLVHKGKK